MAQILEYQSIPRRRVSRFAAISCGVAVGAFVTFFAVVGSIISGGAGHGHYTIARAAYPLPMLITLITDNTTIGLPSMAVALAQFPAYGFAIAYSATRSRRSLLITLAAILVIHGSAALACFSGAVPNFS